MIVGDDQFVCCLEYVEISGNSPAAHPDFSREPLQTGEGYRCSPTYLSTSMYTNRITAMK